MGRPPIGKTAMSDAERQRRHRDRVRVTKPNVARLVQEQAAEIARLQAELARLSPVQSESEQPTKPQSPKLTQAERNARAAAGRAAAKARRAEREAYDEQIQKDNKARIRKLDGLKAKAADSAVTVAEAEAFSAKAKELEERGPRKYDAGEYYAYKRGIRK